MDWFDACDVERRRCWRLKHTRECDRIGRGHRRAGAVVERERATGACGRRHIVNVLESRPDPLGPARRLLYDVQPDKTDCENRALAGHRVEHVGLACVKPVGVRNVCHVDPGRLDVDRAVIECNRGGRRRQVAAQVPLLACNLIELDLVEAGEIANVGGVRAISGPSRLPKPAWPKLLNLENDPRVMSPKASATPQGLNWGGSNCCQAVGADPSE